MCEMSVRRVLVFFLFGRLGSCVQLSHFHVYYVERKRIASCYFMCVSDRALHVSVNEWSRKGRERERWRKSRRKKNIEQI